jgi:hypothetical protein
MTNARLRLAFGSVTRKLGEPPGSPRPTPLVRFADKTLRVFPTPLHAPEPETGS